MTEIMSDLTGLFVPPGAAPGQPAGGPGVRFGQGLITAWDANTGQNTIEWAGGTLTDVPILNTGEAVALREGHVVGMLGQGLTWFIIGRITPANDPNFAGASLAFAALNDQTTNFSLSNVLATKSSVSLDVPPWADEAAVFVIGACTIVNPAAGANFISASVFIDGNPGPGIQQGIDTGSPVPSSNQHLQSITVSSSRLHIPTSSSILCEMKIRVNSGSFAAHATNIAEISAMAVFRATV